VSRRTVRYLVCDKPLCTARYVHGGQSSRTLVPLSTLRQAAKRDGWKRTSGRRDYCPDHNPWPGFAAWAVARPEGVAR